MPLDHPLAFNKRHDHKTYNQLIWVLIYFSTFQDLFVNKLLNGEVLKILLSNAKTAYSIRGSPTPMHPPRSLPWTCPICHSAYVLVLLVCPNHDTYYYMYLHCFITLSESGASHIAEKGTGRITMCVSIVRRLDSPTAR